MSDSNADPRISRTVRAAVSRWSQYDMEITEDATIYQDYKKRAHHKWLFMLVCAVIVIVVLGVAVTVGGYNIGFFESYEVIWNHLTGNIVDSTKDYVVINLRMPRIVAGIIAGAGLATAGVVMQSTLMNPLADTYTTGVSSGASFGAALAMSSGVSFLSGSYSVVVCAFVFALIPLTVILFVSKIRSTSPTTMIMAGIAIMYVFNALTTVIMLWAEPNQLSEIYAWQVGSLSSVTWDQIPIMLAVVAVGMVLCQFLSKKLNVLATGDDSANAMGVDAGRTRMLLLIIVSLMAAAIVSFTGLIGFVGLVVPHIVRLFIGSDNRYLIPASAIAGAAVLIAADLVGRIILYPTVVHVGVVMAFLGGPTFLWLIVRKKSDVWG